MVRDDAKDKLTKRTVICLVAFLFLTFILVDVVFICLAQKTDNGQVTQNAYNKGLVYNEVIQANKWQIENGFDGIISLSCNGYQVLQYKKEKYKKLNGKQPRINGDSGIYCNIQLLLNKKINPKLLPNHFTVKIKRKVTNYLKDIITNIDYAKDNLYQGSVVLPTIGLWQVQMYANLDPQHSIYFGEDFVIESQQDETKLWQ